MRFARTFLPTILLALSTLPAADGPAAPAAKYVGFTRTAGGSGGAVLRVTNLKAEGPGSLREALAAKGPRIVVFEVGGVIDLGKKSLVIAEPRVTVAGQTAPSPGITLIRGALSIRASDVVVRHLRVRPGDAGEKKRSGWEPDGISVVATHDVIVDHCSVTWAVDENLSASGPRLEGPEATSRRVTISNCLIAECLSDSSHKKGEHSKGSLIHDYCREIAVVGNLYAHNVARNPYFKAHCTGAIVNNFIYNPRSAAIQLSYSAGEWKGSEREPANCRVAIVGNVLRHGADTRKNLPLVASKGDAFLADNLASGRDGKAVPITGGKIVRLEEKPVWPEGLEPLPAEQVVEHVLARAGARPADRDAVDVRIIREIREGKGRVIDSQEEVGGYPAPEPTARKLDVPVKGVDAWLAGMAAELEEGAPAE